MEFPDVFSELFEGAHEKLQNDLLLKLDVIRKCESISDNKSDIRSRFASLFMFGRGCTKTKAQLEQE